MKILYITTIGATMRFFSRFISQLIEAGHQVDIACGEIETLPDYYIKMGCSVHKLSCTRSPLRKENIITIKEIKEIVQNEKYDIVHCHTPIVAACTRLACKSIRKKGTKIIYTAHGFHFYHGAPLKNWLFYYPIEWITSWYTDVLITINKEDYALAQKKLHSTKLYYVPGVGIDTEIFYKHRDGERIRTELGINKDTFVLLSVGELNENKNHKSVIKAISGMNIAYVIVGDGELKLSLTAEAKKVGSNVIFAGYRTDVLDFYAASDAFILPSYREGLNVSLMEAMASGLPCLCGRIRGNIDLVDESGGILFNPQKIDEIRLGIEKIMQSNIKYGEHNKKKIQSFDLKLVNKMMFNIYESIAAE